MRIIFVTDYVCPYCIVGKRALKEAVKELGLDVEIITYPMELTVEPEPRVDTWNDEHRKSHYTVLLEPAKSLGLDVKFPPHVVPRPYTRLAFEGHYFAKEHGLEDIYDDRMYTAYFIDEKDIGDITVLAELASSIGLDRDAYVTALQNATYTELFRKEDTYSKTVLDVHSIPTFFVNGQRYQFEEYSKEEAIRILKEQNEKKKGII